MPDLVRALSRDERHELEYKLREAVARRLFQFRVLDGPGNLAWEVPSLHEVNLLYMTDAMFHAKVDSLTRDILTVLDEPCKLPACRTCERGRPCVKHPK